ncbi:YitT family protein [Bacillus sp. RG28]|uniref:YitT family protein n=1 Tax=Gottfriedia endophytica TaxID=2820819 RepID=A0A940NGN9_9BACI|nr:YitT family protein [Gottfriedia endophytica]MBP0723642.1 YitT family protein [Gottfriedia endophytica]
MNRQSKPKYIFYGLGILILTLGISFTIQSDLGTSPFDALLVGLSIRIGLTVGSWEIIIALLLIFINSILKRQKPEFLGLLTSFITGFGIDMWLFLLHNVITPEQWFSKAVCFAIGLIIIGVGSAIYLQTNFAPIPVDHLMLIIRELTGMNLFFSKTLIYLLFLIMAIIFNGPVGIGTIFTVCFGGSILNYFMPLVAKGLKTNTETDTATTSEISETHSV